MLAKRTYCCGFSIPFGKICQYDLTCQSGSLPICVEMWIEVAIFSHEGGGVEGTLFPFYSFTYGVYFMYTSLFNIDMSHRLLRFVNDMESGSCSCFCYWLTYVM